MEENSVSKRTIYRRHLFPNWVTFAVIGLIVILTFFYLISVAGEATTPMIAGIFCAGPIFILPFLALFLKSPPVGRIYMLGFAALSLAFTGLISSILVAMNPNEGVTSGVGLFMVITVPATLILLIPLFFFMRQMLAELRQALYLNRVRRAAEIIGEKGKQTFSELGIALNVAPSEVDNIVDEVKERGWTAVTMYTPFQRVYERAHLRQTQQAMVDRIQERGQLYLDDLAIEMQTPMRLLTEWIYQLVQDGRFTGFINWDTAVLYSTNAQKLRASSRCPNCDGQLQLDGERVRCAHCNSEILVGVG